MKNIAICLLTVFVLSCFAGCSVGKSDKNTDKTDTDASQSTAAASSQNESTASLPETVPVQAERPEKITKIYTESIGFTEASPQKGSFYDEKNGNSLPYCLYVPKDYSPKKKYPVILFLHGAGELGNDNTSQLRCISNMFKKNGDFIAQCILVCPQTSVWWNLDGVIPGDGKGTLTSALHLLEDIEKTYSCDKNRLYVTGLSMGGYATWDLLERYGDIFAAGVPLCGGGNAYNGAAFKDIPIRIYHGTADGTVSFSNSKRMYDAIVAAGGKNVELFPLEGYGHDVWNYTYGDRDMFSWLFAQNKANKKAVKYDKKDIVSVFKITDKNGKTVVSDGDIVFTNFIMGGNGSGIRANIRLSDSGAARLNEAYKSSGGGEFTVYIAGEKFYSFTATEPADDKMFVMAGVLTGENYASVKSTLDMAMTSK